MIHPGPSPNRIVHHRFSNVLSLVSQLAGPTGSARAAIVIDRPRVRLIGETPKRSRQLVSRLLVNLFPVGATRFVNPVTRALSPVAVSVRDVTSITAALMGVSKVEIRGRSWPGIKVP